MFHNQDLVFTEDTHIYTDSEGELNSVGSIIKKYTNEYNPSENELLKTASKKGMSVNKLLTYYEDKKNTAIIRGKLKHNINEYYFNALLNNNEEMYLSSLDEIDRHILLKVINNIPILKYKNKINIFTEQILANHKLRISGTADLLIQYFYKFLIYDYKTNEKIEFTNKWRKMKYPFHNYDDCNYNHYKLQLSHYAFLLTKLGYEVCAFGLIWINHDNKVQKIEFEKDMIDILNNNLYSLN